MLIEPFFSGSHLRWASELQANSGHEIRFLTLPGRHWKWRMHGAAVTLSEHFLRLDFKPDLILASDMLDLSVFLALARSKLKNTRVAVYFHENQLTYPWSPDDQDVQLQRDNHYAFINYTSALAADWVFFNSEYHRNSFLNALPEFLRRFPDHQNMWSLAEIDHKSSVLPIGLDLGWVEETQSASGATQTDKPGKVVLWNHRWEFDKNPEAFFQLLMRLAEKGLAFSLVVLGEKTKKHPPIFNEAKEILKDRILHWGYAKDAKTYREWLKTADILPVTSNQDFFGMSTVEAMAAGVLPLLPNRLACPAHIPEHLRGTYLYESEKDLEIRLAKWLKEKLPDTGAELADFVKKYDWKNLIPKYDRAFSRIAEGLPH